MWGVVIIVLGTLWLVLGLWAMKRESDRTASRTVVMK